MTEEHPQGFRECKDELSIGKVQQDFLIQVFGKEERPLLTTGGAQIKSLTGEGAEIVVTAVRIAAADTGYPLSVVTAGEKVLSNSLDPFETKLPECIGILLIIPAEEIGEMTLEDLMEGVSSPRKVSTGLCVLYGALRYSHILNYRERGESASREKRREFIEKACSIVFSIGTVGSVGREQLPFSMIQTHIKFTSICRNAYDLYDKITPITPDFSIIHD